MDELKYLKYLGECVHIHLLKKLITPHGKIKNNLIISITTIPSRSKYIIKTINSLLAQTILPRQIYIGISDSCYREPNIQYSLPAELYNNPLITVVSNDKDFGPVMKLVTGIYNSKKTDYIITVDDDVIYEKHAIEKLYNSAKNDKSNSVHCAIGRDGNGIKILHSKKKINFETLEGYGGVIYNKQHFKSDFMEKMVTYEKYILMNDDLIISSYLKSNSIEIKHVNVHKYKPFITISASKNPLNPINRRKDYFKKSYHALNLFNAKNNIKYH
jgi:glycosyltransferase involved in cell wall biosynthesis